MKLKDKIFGEILKDGGFIDLLNKTKQKPMVLEIFMMIIIWAQVKEKI